MKKRRFTRRSFLRQAAVAGLVGSAAAVVGPSVGRLFAQERPQAASQDDLVNALTTALGDQVVGLEKNNAVAKRLAVNLATMQGRKPTLVARQQILFLAARGVPRGHQPAMPSMPRSVSANLNDLLTMIRGQRGASQLIKTLLAEVITSVLFATHGIHFDDTRAAHQAFRGAVLAMKDRNSEVSIATRIAEKRRLLAEYKSAIFSRAKEVALLGFPTDVRIRSAWIMTDSRSGRAKRRA